MLVDVQEMLRNISKLMTNLYVYSSIQSTELCVYIDVYDFIHLLYFWCWLPAIQNLEIEDIHTNFLLISNHL